MATIMKNGLILHFPLKKCGMSHKVLPRRLHIPTVSTSSRPRSYLKSLTQNQGCFNQSRSFHQTGVHSLWSIPSPLSDPLNSLNEFTVDPVLPAKDQLFTPTEEDVKGAAEFFSRQRGSITAQKGVVALKDLPLLEYPEVAFLGRSNVGKSSLIKSIFRDPNVKVSVSKKPGHTRVLKFYHVGKFFSMVDMPGYGFHMPEYFVESMEEYLKTRRQLTKVFLLIDAKVGLISTDEIAIEMMEEVSKPYVIVLTKLDKTTPSRVINHVMAIRRRIRRDTNCCFPQPFLTSSTNGWGIALLQSFITYITSAQQFKSIS